MGVVRRMRRGIGRLLALAVLCAGTALPVSSVSAQSNDISMQDITRLGGHGTDKLWGIGLVFGLPGTNAIRMPNPSPLTANRAAKSGRSIAAASPPHPPSLRS